jgi:hypothetical protein
MGGSDPPAVVYCYAPGRGTEHCRAHLAGFSGILQTDGYTAYKELVRSREPSAPIVLSFCWAHLRRRFYEIAGKHPVKDAVERVVPVLTRLEPFLQACPNSKAAVHRYGWPDNRADG